LIPTLSTERLTLRPIAAADTDAVTALFADPELSRFRYINLADPAEAEAWVARRLAYRGPAGTGEWVIDLAGEVIGVGRLKPSTELPGGVLETGCYLAKRHQGQGLAREATEAILRHARDALAAPAVFALIHKENQPSLALAARLGFLTVGEGDHYGAPHHVLVSLPQTPTGPAPRRDLGRRPGRHRAFLGLAPHRAGLRRPPALAERRQLAPRADLPGLRGLTRPAW
jgi:RimJ/RimL family protein N-acetyltransferase